MNNLLNLQKLNALNTLKYNNLDTISLSFNFFLKFCYNYLYSAAIYRLQWRIMQVHCSYFNTQCKPISTTLISFLVKKTQIRITSKTIWRKRRDSLFGKSKINVLKSLTKSTFANIIFTSAFTVQGVLNKDPAFWPDGARMSHKYFCRYIKIVFSPNCLTLIYDSVIKLFRDVNRTKVLYGENYTDN